MQCSNHGKEIVDDIGNYKICNITGLPCPHHGVLAFSEKTNICDETCFFAELLVKMSIKHHITDDEEGFNGSKKYNKNDKDRSD